MTNGNQLSLYREARRTLITALNELSPRPAVVDLARKLLSLRAEICQRRAAILREKGESCEARANEFAAEQLRRAAETLGPDSLTPAYVQGLVTMLPPDP